ncbi:hypothetical protein HK405_008347, partial [Cladochytrium tenue]
MAAATRTKLELPAAVAGAVQVYLRNKSRVVLGLRALLAASVLLRVRSSYLAFRRASVRRGSSGKKAAEADAAAAGTSGGGGRGRGKKGKVGPRGEVDAVFLKQVLRILRIVCPLRSKEFLVLNLFSAFLVARTWLSLVVAELDGRIVSALVQGNGKQFLLGIA